MIYEIELLKELHELQREQKKQYEIAPTEELFEDMGEIDMQISEATSALNRLLYR